MPRHLKTFIVLILPVLYGILSCQLGKDINWDLKNYHYYNAYAFLNNRIDVDIIPAQMQSYFNPILDLPFYFLTAYLPCRWVGFIMGCLHGLNLSFVFLIFCNITKYQSENIRLAIAIILLLVAGSAPGFISELGGTMNDNLVNLFVISALYYAILSSDQIQAQNPRWPLTLAFAGFLMGAGTGFKPTLATYALASALALPALFSKWREKLQAFLFFGIGGVAGGVATAGYWCMVLWNRFGNPFFPLFNNIFLSPWSRPASLRDDRYVPEKLWDILLWPFVINSNSYRVTEIKFYDIRLSLLYIAFLAWGLCLIRQVKTENRNFDQRKSLFMILFFGLSFVFWAKVFSIYRYFISLEFLIPVVFLALLDRITSSNKTRIAVGLCSTIAVFSVFKPADWGRTPWRDPYIRVACELNPLPDEAVVLMLGQSPMAYIVPNFPPSTRFLRPEGNLGLDGQEIYHLQIKSLADQNKQNGKLFLLWSLEEDTTTNPTKSLKRLGLTLKQLDCYDIKTNMRDRFKLCRVKAE